MHEMLIFGGSLAKRRKKSLNLPRVDAGKHSHPNNKNGSAYAKKTAEVAKTNEGNRN